MGVIAKLTRGWLYSQGLRLGALDGYERLIAGIYGKPDRVPVIVQPYTYAMAMHRLSSRRFFAEPEPFINASANMARYFGFDHWSPVFDFYNIELEALGQRLIWKEGSEPDVDTAHPLVASEEDLGRLAPPVPGKSGRMPYVLESYRRYMDIVGVPPMAYCCSPFTMAVLVRGYVNFLRDMRRNPAFAHRLMRFLSMEVVAPWIDRMVQETDAAIVVMSDAWASAPNMTTAMVREFCLPYVQQVIKATNSPMRTVLDSGSWGERETADPGEIMDIKLAMMLPGNSLRAMRPFFLLVWNEDYEAVGIEPVRSYAERHRVALMLNLRPDLIEDGPPGRIVETVRGLMHRAARKGRFVLLVNLVPVGTPALHVHTAVAAARQFGVYPFPADLDAIPFMPPAFERFDQWLATEGLPV